MPFDQPAVEEGKVLAKKYLARIAARPRESGDLRAAFRVDCSDPHSWYDRISSGSEMIRSPTHRIDDPSWRRASCARPVRAGRTSTSCRPRCSCASTCAHSPSLPNDVAIRLMRLAGKRLTKDGVLVIIAQSHRTRSATAPTRCERLIELIREAAVRAGAAPRHQAPKASKREAARGQEAPRATSRPAQRPARGLNSGG